MSENSRDDPPRPVLPAVISYRDGDTFVLCERSNAKAWIRSDVTQRLPR